MTKEFLILNGGQIYTEQGVVKNSAVVIKDKKIMAITAKDDIKNYASKKVYDFPDNFFVLPGFIDMHIHGSNGKDVMDASFDALQTIAESLAKSGTTSFLATTMTARPKEIENVLCHVRDYMKRQDDISGARVLGVHLEGPFLSPNKVGAQRKDLILNPDIKLLETWQKISKEIIKCVTLAPELENSLMFIEFLKQKNIIASIGHTDATFDEACKAIDAGCTHATHLFNAMRGIHQREPGAVTAALLSDQVNAELIVDGVHLHPAIINLILKLKSKQNLMLVTDAMRAQCLKDGNYDLGGQTVSVKNYIAKLADGTLAGSTLKMSEAIKNMMRFTSCNLHDVIQMASANPAKALNVFHQKGSIAKDKDADIAIFNPHFESVLTVCEGKCCFSK